MSRRFPIAVAAAVCGGLVSLAAPASALTLLGPSAYSCFDSTAIAGCTADSPFATADFSGGYFHLENFEDGLLNTPGASASGGGVTGPGGITDSVDEDDGTVDGLGQQGRSWFGGGATGFVFTFNAGTLGVLPTHVGIVWTDGAAFNEVTFQVFDAMGALADTIVAPNIGDGNFLSGTAEDRFFGAIDAGGISAIRIFNSVLSGGGSGIEVDHLQYGNGVVAPVAEPAALGVLGLGLAALGLAGAGGARRRRLPR